MRIAVLGVGLIGGSIGLAARRRLDAEVAGFDPDRANLDRALELGRAVGGGAVGAARRWPAPSSCSARRPVRALPEVVAEALAASGDDTVVTDVGSTKRELVAGAARPSRRPSGSSAATRSRAPRPPASSTRAPTCSRARAGT